MIIRTAIAIASVVLLSACTPQLTQADEHGGVVSDLTNMKPEEALAMAQAHCRQYGRTARVNGTAGDAMMFDCVP